MAEITIDQALQTAIAHHRAGRLRDAEAIYRLILEQNNVHPDALHLLGVLSGEAGKLRDGVELIQRAIAANPRAAHYFCNLGFILYRLGDLDRAIETEREAIKLRPDYAEANLNLGLALLKKGQLNDAIAAFSRTIELKQYLAQAHSNLGLALAEQGNLEQAVNAYRVALQHDPRFAPAYNNMSMALRDRGEFEAAIDAAHSAIQLDGNYAEAHTNLGISLLLNGEFNRGWSEYEWRCKFQPERRQELSGIRQWDGSPLNGATILLHCEQGLGDTIQFARYVPLVAARGAQVLLGCQGGLVRLLESLAGADAVFDIDQQLPVFDLRCQLLSLPRIFRTDLKSIPQSVPYIGADTNLVSAWKEKIDRQDSPQSSLRIGLAWAGSPSHKNDRNRSIPLRQLASLASVSGTSFFSLQKGDAAAEAAATPAAMRLIDMTNDLGDFADTAALIANLDLVISVDTSVGHLAGAMGKPVWVLLPFVPDWRWMRDRVDSPWYPTMRLFRQNRADDWDQVIQRMTGELRQLVGNGQGL